MNEFKTDLKPIIIYFVGLFGSTIPFFILFSILKFKNPMNLSQLICESFICILFIFLYYKLIKKDILRLKVKDYIYIVIYGIILYLLNELATGLFLKLNVSMYNQDTLISLLNDYKLLTIIYIVLIGPIVEELVFRYSFSTFIKNDHLFLLISSLTFAIIHGVGIITILYFLMGVALGYIYLKTNKNIVASTIVHIINNLISVILMLI